MALTVLPLCRKITTTQVSAKIFAKEVRKSTVLVCRSSSNIWQTQERELFKCFVTIYIWRYCSGLQ